MDRYELWFNLKPNVTDMEFADAFEGLAAHLKKDGLIQAAFLARRKLGFGPPELGEFWASLHVENLEQLDRAFQTMAGRHPEAHRAHAAVFGRVKDLRTALYRDFPDPSRRRQSPLGRSPEMI